MARNNAANESWETESGLLEEYELTVEEAFFGEVEDSDTGRLYLFLRGTAVDDEDEEYEDWEDRYSTGKNWEVVDGGQGVEKLSGRQKFHNGTGMGVLIEALSSIDDDTTKLLQERGNPTDASMFVGLVLSQERTFIRDIDTDDGPFPWHLPLPQSVAEAGGSKKGRAAKPKRTRPAANNNGLRTEIIEFAEQFKPDEHDTFVDEVLDPEVFDLAEKIIADPELHADVLDDEGEIWTEAH